MNPKTYESADPKRRKPGRPRGFDPSEVLDSALEIFWKRGYAATTTRDLEHGLGLGQSSLYNEFGSKQALLDSVLDRYQEMTTKALLNSMDKKGDGLQAIRQFFHDLTDWITRDGRRGCMLINMMAEDGTATETITQRTRLYRQRVRTALKACLKRAAEAGDTTASSIDERANLLLGLVLGINIAARGGASRRELNGLLGAAQAQVDAWRC